tara:strand:- start:268 stop:378 length:111 start_codon:yes stop_codon:yes gene_type:complete
VVVVVAVTLVVVVVVVIVLLRVGQCARLMFVLGVSV